jgi:hypothetical protein
MVIAQRCGSPGAGFIGDPVEPLVRAYFIGSIPRSLHIFLARSSSISVCRGTDERLFWLGFPHQECRDPSLTNSQPCVRRYFNNSVLFMQARLSSLLCSWFLRRRSHLDG